MHRSATLILSSMLLVPCSPAAAPGTAAAATPAAASHGHPPHTIPEAAPATSLRGNTAAPRPAPASRSGSGRGLRFARRADGRIVVPVHIGGTGPYQFVLDTGSNLSVVSDALAGRLGLSPVARVSVSSPSGLEERLVVAAAQVQAGGLALDRLLASVVSESAIRAAAGEVDGLLGAEALGDRAFTLDYRAGRLEWDDEAPSQVPATAPLRLDLVARDGRYLVRLPQANGGPVLELVADTGADALVLFDTPRTAHLALRPAGAGVPMPMLDVGGRVRLVERVIVGTLQIDRLTWRHQAAVLVRRAPQEPDTSDGLLPLHRFTRVSIHPAEGYLLLQP
ncbi:MAG: aspartyl protease family protein [Vicinamibacterales bacterium]